MLRCIHASDDSISWLKARTCARVSTMGWPARRVKVRAGPRLSCCSTICFVTLSSHHASVQAQESESVRAY